MRKYKTIIIEKNELEKVFCNCCGEEIKKDEYGEMEDYITIKKSWGYNSSFDGQKHEFDICNRCYKKWINSFAHKIQNEEAQ